MNQTFSGFMLLGIVVLITVVLFTIGWFIKPKPASSSKRLVKHKSLSKGVAKFKSKKRAFNNQINAQIKIQLSTLKEVVSKNFPEFTASLRQNYLILERASEKVAMLTIDKAAAVGRRRLGNITVINFHSLPSVEELRIELNGL